MGLVPKYYLLPDTGDTSEVDIFSLYKIKKRKQNRLFIPIIIYSYRVIMLTILAKCGHSINCLWFGIGKTLLAFKTNL